MERLFISWVGLRGAVPVMLAIFPLVAGLEQAQLLFNAAFIVVLLSLLLQGASLPLAARLCKVEIPPPPDPLYRTGLEVMVESDYELMSSKLSQPTGCLGTKLRWRRIPLDPGIPPCFGHRNRLHPS